VGAEAPAPEAEPDGRAAPAAAPVTAPETHADLLSGTEPAGARALAAGIASTYGNQHLQRVLRTVVARETETQSLVAQLDDELDDVFVDEELCIGLIERMTPTEKASITTTAYRDKLASALDEDEMIRVVRALEMPLVTKLEWIRAGTWLADWEIDYEDVSPFIAGAPAAERDAIKTEEWRTFFVGVCTDATMSLLVDVLFTALKDQIRWLAAEEVPWSMLRARLVSATDAAQKLALYDDEAIMNAFVSACDNDEMAEAVILIGGTMAQKQVWLDAEGTSTDEYLNALVRLQVFEAGTVTHTRAVDADSAIAAQLGELVAGAKGDGRQIAGMVAVVGDDDFNAAGINHYGATVWATKSLNGFVDSDDRVWIHRDRGNAGTMIHEGLHKWSKDDVLDLSQPLNEGVTEYFTRKVCAGMTPPQAVGRTNYQNNWSVTTALVSLVGETTVAAAYFDGDTAGLQTAYEGKKSAADWTAFLTACSADDWTTAATKVTP
jgi:hypothetical protein